MTHKAISIFIMFFVLSMGLTACGRRTTVLNLGWLPSTTNPCSAIATWDANIPPPSVTAYKLYYGRISGQYTDFVDTGVSVTKQVENFKSGTYYFAVTAYNDAGESDYSNEVTRTFPASCGL